MQHLAERKGCTLEFAHQAAAGISNRVQEVGLAFNYDRTVAANTFEAHLTALAVDIGLPEDDVKNAPGPGQFADDVRRAIAEAMQRRRPTSC